MYIKRKYLGILKEYLSYFPAIGIVCIQVSFLFISWNFLS